MVLDCASRRAEGNTLMNKGNVWKFFAAGGIAASLVLAAGSATAAGFTVTSSAFADGGMLVRKNAADDPMRMCGGENISPPIAWANPPANTKSFALMLLDPDGLLGQGVVHWIGYGIPGSAAGLAEGDMTRAGKFVGGKGTRNNANYIGPCPPVGDSPHHYIFTVVATDLEPSALKADMTRDELMAALKGHSLGGASIVGKYAR